MRRTLNQGKKASEQATTRLEEKLLRRLADPNDGFHFSEGSSNPIGGVALSLRELVRALETIPLPSIEFHMARGNLSAWIRNVIGDHELATKLEHIDVRGQDLRTALVRTLNERLAELWYMADYSCF